MNKREKEILTKLHEALTAVPPLNDGRRVSHSPTGYIAEIDDLRLLVAWGIKALVMEHDQPKSKLTDGLQGYHDPKYILDAIEEWLVQRERVQWRSWEGEKLIEIYYQKIKDLAPF